MRALIMAGGTGGHIFPGMALAESMRRQGWTVGWIGHADGMERPLVEQQAFSFFAVAMRGVRAKGVRRFLQTPGYFLLSLWQCWRIFRFFSPQIVVGFGGYVSVPGGVLAWLMGITLVVHEQNAVSGLANRMLGRLARVRCVAFPHALPHATLVGNPVRPAMLTVAVPEERFAHRQGVLQVLIFGGSLGARVLNECIPRALQILPAERRPVIYHQCGVNNGHQVRSLYAQLAVQAQVFEFIDDMAHFYQCVDFVICRAGASTIAELSVVGLGALLVPYPFAVDDHQTVNARFLAAQGAAKVLHQKDLTVHSLAAFLSSIHRTICLRMAIQARAVGRRDATAALFDACVRAVPSQYSV